MDKNKLKSIVESIENATITGADQATLGQVIEDSLDPLLKEHIYELHYRHHDRNNENFAKDFELHKEIVKFFEEMGHAYFSFSDLKKILDLENRLYKESLLDEKKELESRTENILRMLESYIKEIRPFISPQKAQAFLNKGKNLPVKYSDNEITDIVKRTEIVSEEQVYTNYFKALISKDQVFKYLTLVKEGRIKLQNSFLLLDEEEAVELDYFKHDKHHKYSSLVYAVKYGEWRLQQMRKGIVTINVVHRFE